jgi:uncharacterized membrane protein
MAQETAKNAPLNQDLNHELALIKEQAKVELNRLQAQSTAKEVAGKAIGESGLFYITLIIVIGVGSSVVLENEKIAAVMGLLGAALTALISMLNNIAGANAKQEKPEFEVMKQLIDKLDRLEQPMRVDVEGDKVTVRKGDDVVTAKKE